MITKEIHAATTTPLALLEPSRTAWDAFVQAHPHGNLLQQSHWGELKAGFGWRVRHLAVCDGHGALLAGAQLLLRSRYGLSLAYTPRGPLFASAPAVNHLLLNGIIRVARRARAIFLRLEPPLLEHDPQADGFHTWLLLQGLHPAATIQPRSSIHVDLNQPEASLLANCSKGHRADIRRAERNGVHVRVGSSSDLGTFQAIMEATGQRAGFAVHSAAYYQTAWQRFQPQARLLLAELNGQTVAAHLVFADAHAGLYLYSGAAEAGLRSGANHLLAWEAMRWARSLGCSYYDLWGIPDALGRAVAAPDPATHAALEATAATDPLQGVYRFKKGFGGSVVRYLPAYDHVLLPPLYALALRSM
ncbi:MAG: peptidoglycan bridge formation glycyltransferase FemA/FemB family protein [Candidatus Viridilinea halotolerans]|uniref:Peptidoglycan bridge formation glycyltransferase FemA/FemB family protein n=1 Tax=Candidatus Viridilinea halotolerans TaxID=2491704 RepID=A0A426U9Q5_9CHLR|nr:MAG: peptidoglycan bridge formation glycyltransferase FemA/FemB family protein [Candidatus Viridilinea halotolerans]